MGIDSKCNFALPTVLLGLLYPWTWGISSFSLQRLTSNAEEAEVELFYEDLQDLLELTPKRDVLFIIMDWNAKVGSQKIPGIRRKFGLGVQN